MSRRRRLALTAVAWTLDLLYLLATPALFLVLLVASRGFTRPKLTRGLGRRLRCDAPRRVPGPSLWVHAVSVGEVLTAAPLVRALREALPGRDVSLSVSTYTGFEVATRALPEIEVFWFPLDPGPCVERALELRRPDAVLLVELELWPRFLVACARRGVPVLVANGRLTERSARRYARLGPLARGLFGLPASFAVQNDAYASRFRRVGVAPDRLRVLGNLKHDRVPTLGAAEADELRRKLGWPRGESLILVAGSTHAGEETALLEMLPRLRTLEPRLRLILVPRHVERLVPDAESAWLPDRPVVRWTERVASGPEAGPLGDAVLLVDVVGQLELFYAASDLAFVGGSLVPRGGHNVLEPAVHGRATLFGPSHENFEEEVEVLLSRNAARRVAGPVELERVLGELLGSATARAEIGERARATVETLRGAVARHVEWLRAEVEL